MFSHDQGSFQFLTFPFSFSFLFLSFFLFLFLFLFFFLLSHSLILLEIVDTQFLNFSFSFFFFLFSTFLRTSDSSKMVKCQTCALDFDQSKIRAHRREHQEVVKVKCLAGSIFPNGRYQIEIKKVNQVRNTKFS